MRRIVFPLLLVAMLLSACGENRFEKEMRMAKDDLLEGNYTKAKSSLEIALIEEPNNKDALALLEKTEQFILLEKKKQYIQEAKGIYNDLLEISSAINYPITEYMEPETAEIKVNEVQKILDKAKALNDLWSSEPDVRESVDYLTKSAQSIYDVYSILEENIHEELEVTNSGPNGLQSLYDKARAVIRSNDSVIRANTEYDTYNDYSRGFETRISKLETILNNS